jgi:hypothetical protein
MTVEKKEIVETKGYNSKLSSKVYIVKIKQEESTELDDFFGPLDPVKRALEYK